MEERVKNFLAESVELIDSAYDSIKVLKNSVSEKKDPVNTINVMFRVFHTVKGLAGMNNFQNLAMFTHEIENLLYFLRRSSNYSEVDRIADVLFSSLDVFEVYFENIKKDGNDNSVPKEQNSIVENVNSLIKILELEKTESSDDLLKSIPESLTGQLNDLELSRLKTNIKNNKFLLLCDLALSFDTFDVDLKKINKELDEKGELVATLPGPDLADEEKISFSLLIACNDLKTLENIFPEESIINPIFEPDKSDKNINLGKINRSNEFSDEFTKKTIESKASKKKNKITKSSKSIGLGFTDDQKSTGQESLRVFLEDIDKIVSGLEDFTIVKNNFEAELRNLQIAEAENAVVERLKLYADKLGSHISSFQKQIIGLRMIPLSNIFRRIESATVRTAKSLDKKVHLVFKGGDTAVDKPITDKLIEPLIHLLRNSVDHGIESVEERLSVGKDPDGTIVFNAFQQGNSVFIEISDDGKGIDISNVLKKAIVKGFVPTTKDYTKQEIIDFIFTPGFSTVDEISDISGRGVGMDVVKNTLNSIGGNIVIESEQGKGTKALIQIPVTQAVISLFLIKSGEFLLGIPSFYVTNVEKFESTKSKYVQSRMYYRLQEKTIPIVNISLLLNTIDLDTTPSIVMVVNYLGQDYGLLVENILEEKEVTVKPLSGKLKNIPLVSGICEFSSKSLIYVIDLGDLIDHTGVKYV